MSITPVQLGVGGGVVTILALFALSFIYHDSSDHFATKSYAGVTYRGSLRGLPPVKDVVAVIENTGIPRVRLIDPNYKTVASFAGTNVELSLSIENLDLFTAIANDTAAARKWVADVVYPNFRKVSITSISVGYGILTHHPHLSGDILHAVLNVQSACAAVGLIISISTAHSYNIITNLFPPSNASFNSTYLPYLEDLTALEEMSSSSFMIDVYPFEIYRRKLIPGLSVSFSVFDSSWSRDLEDVGSGVKYDNLFDVMVDAVMAALARIGHAKTPILVVGTGWPSNAYTLKRPHSSPLYGAEYVERLVFRLNHGLTSPLRREPPVTFVYEMIDEAISDDPDSLDKSWGIMTAKLEPKYNISFTAAGGRARPPAAALVALAAGASLLLW